MRIAELTTYTSRLNGGVFQALSQLLPRLAATSGTDVRVFGYADRHTEDDRGAWGSISVEAFAPWPPKYFGFSPGFFPAIARFQPDLVHAHGLWTYLSAASLRLHRSRGTPLVVSPHGMLDPWALSVSPRKKRIVARAFQDAQLRSATVIHALNQPEAKAVRAYGLTNPIVVIPNGVAIPAIETTATHFPARVVAGGQKRRVVFLGRLHAKKGLPALLEAWHRLAAGDDGTLAKDWELVIAGWDESGHESELRAQVARLGLQQSVSFVGAVMGSAKVGLLQGADAFVLPSLSEGLPVAVLEAWSYALPVLMTTACNLPEGAACGAAIEVSPGTTSLVEGLRSLFALSDERRREMGEAGRDLVERDFAWPRVVANMARLYRALVEREPLPAELVYTEARDVEANT